MTTHTPEAIAQEERKYLQVFLLLGVLTVMEIGVVYLPIPKLAIALMLVIMAGAKAALVALYYMHLATERTTLMWIALTPAILCVFLLFMLTPDLGALTRIVTSPSPAAPTAH
jgi:cytochrome c oxidase subunit 4